MLLADFQAMSADEVPEYLIRDRDGVFGLVLRRRLGAIGIRDSPTLPRSPWQNGYAERVIGSIRREDLDHMIVLGEGHLRRVMTAYIAYYNQARTHLTLSKDAATRRDVRLSGSIKLNPTSRRFASSIYADIVFGRDSTLFDSAGPEGTVFGIGKPVDSGPSPVINYLIDRRHSKNGSVNA